MLKEFIYFHGKFPSDNYAKRHSFSKRYQTHLGFLHRARQKQQSPKFAQYLKEIEANCHPLALAPAKLKNSLGVRYIFKEWTPVLTKLREESIGMDELYSFSFSNRNTYIESSKSLTVREHMIKSLDISGVHLKDVGFHAKKGTMQYLLSYFVYEEKFTNLLGDLECIHSNPISLPQLEKVYNNMMYFKSKYYGDIPNELKECSDAAFASCFKLEMIQDLQSLNGTGITKQERRNMISETLLKYADDFDTFCSLEKGLQGERAVNIFETTFPQPRRLNMSCTSTEEVEMVSFPGLSTIQLYQYGAAGRPVIDGRCRTMPEEVFTLGENVWKYIRNDLDPLARICPPNHCQVCVYNSFLNSEMRPHKDNGYHDKNNKFAGTTTTPLVNSHIFGTSVVIVTMFGEMEMKLTPPPPGKDYTASRKQHMDYANDKPSCQKTTNLKPYSIYVHTAHDDEQTFHSLNFSKGQKTNDKNIILIWLQGIGGIRLMDMVRMQS